MRFLLDTNILIPLEDSHVALPPGLANFVRLAQENGHPLIFHPASELDINRDRDAARRERTRARLAQYTRLDNTQACPWNNSELSQNDLCDNEILYALECDAAHYLVTEDREIHKKGVGRGLGGRVLAIKEAEDFLRRLHEPTSISIPNIDDVPLHSLTTLLKTEFFDSLRGDYPEFDEWFKEGARSNRRAWVYWAEPNTLGALCVYAHKKDDDVTKNGHVLAGASLKLCTFKVAPDCRGRKIGELFLKTAFRYATDNKLENIFIHGDPEKQSFLFDLLTDFGFSEFVRQNNETFFIKNHPLHLPERAAVDFSPFEYFRKFFPHFRDDGDIGKFIVPIQPKFHRALFADYASPADPPQLVLFDSGHVAGNAIKQAYLCHANIGHIKAGDIVLFYRSGDERAVTSVGVVERYETLDNANEIADRVRRRTVYSMREIERIAFKPTKVMLFWLVKHFSSPTTFEWLRANRVVNGNIQTIQEIDDKAFQRIISQAS